MRDHHRRGKGLLSFVAAVCFVTSAVLAQDEDPPTEDPPAEDDFVDFADADMEGMDDLDDILDMAFEELLNINVTSVEGRASSWFTTPAAVTVITNEDIRRTGHRNIAEALRLAPGYNVGQISPSVWSVSSRGFQGRFANKLLVMVDGRTVYDPLFSGTFWHMQSPLLEDLDRIEVIRGPGATLWGANAVNGVVNVTTRSAADTQGLFLQAGFGSSAQGFGAFRYGDEINEDTHYRVWGKYENFDSWRSLDGVNNASEWDFGQMGFRLDWQGDDGVTATVQGDIFSTNRIDERVRVPIPGHLTSMNTTIAGRFRDTNILARIGSMSEADHGWQVQTYFDDNSLVGGQPGLRVDRQTFDIDYRQYATLGSNDEHVLMWGAGFRHTRDDVMAAPTLTFMTLEEELDTVSAFVQDTITLREDELFAMIGSKIQHNDYTDWEIQPSARVWWTPDEKNTVWGAVSRPVRTPSRTNSDVLLTSAFADPSILAGGPPSGLSIPLAIAGNPMAVSEELLSFEAGYRVQPLDGLVVDIATYLNKYERLSYAPIPAGVFAHDADADTYGVEISSSYDICENLHIAGSYTVFQFDPQDAVARAQFDNDTPQQQVQLRAFYDLTDDIEINGAAYWVDGISSVGIDDYFRLDIGVTWRPKPNIEISVWGQNLTEHRHVEDLDTFFQASPIEVERSVYGQISFRY